jgi:hypothetical protein
MKIAYFDCLAGASAHLPKGNAARLAKTPLNTPFGACPTT